ncbi:hypothetical protein MAUB1S_08556 [Mycolicibacterium aubagnense]
MWKGQNETERHFQLRNLDEDMRKAASEVGRVVPRQQVREMRMSGIISLVLFVIIAAVLYAMGLY